MGFRPEPPFAHGRTPLTAILLVNLGTPDEPTPAAVKRYLREFLSDPRVVEIPRPVWWLILNGIVLNVRPRQSAEKYAAIWSAEGSPLRVHTERQAKLLEGYLGQSVASPFTVAYAMRYGVPAIRDVLASLKAGGAERILVLPLYPQFAASTTATVFDEVARFLMETRNPPEVRLVKHFHDHPAYVRAVADAIRETWRAEGRPDRLVMSFHGLPRFSLERGDPYHCECQKTARLLAEELELAPGQWVATFQSRFGKAEWLKPYTAEVLAALGREGVGKVDVVTPGFVSDCLETLEEIGMEGRDTFLAAGGGQYRVIPCLNERADWIRALARIALENLGGWYSTSRDREAAARAAAASRDRARAMGASA
ncbi:MAG: ferrochelatase [Burkholderiales bacterium]|nr:ferrochelatase [Burkholderiales bacterium]